MLVFPFERTIHDLMCAILCNIIILFIPLKVLSSPIVLKPNHIEILEYHSVFFKHNANDKAHIIQSISSTTSYSSVLLVRRAC